MPTLKTNVEKLKADQDVNYSSSDTWHVALLEYQQLVLTATINTTTDVLTTASAHDFLDGTRVQLSSTGLLPTSTPQVLPNTDYFVDSPSGSTLALLDSSGVGINFSSAGTGILTIADQAPNEFDSLEEFLRHETDYEGLTTRPVWDPPATSTISALGKVSKSATLNLDNALGASPCVFNIALLIQNGSATPGSTSGSWAKFYHWDILQSVPAGQAVPLGLEVYGQN